MRQSIVSSLHRRTHTFCFACRMGVQTGCIRQPRLLHQPLNVIAFLAYSLVEKMSVKAIATTGGSRICLTSDKKTRTS